MTKVELQLNPVPDGYGFIYGQAWVGDRHYTVNIMPPLTH